MSHKTHFHTQFAYHTNIFNRLLDCAEKLSEEKYHEHPGHGLGSIHDILFHTLFWQNWWRQGIVFAEKHQRQFLNEENFRTLADLRAGILQEHTAWETTLNNLTDSEIEGEITINDNTYILWRILQHLVIHGMQHHSEVAVLLTEAGQSPGGIDFIWFER